MFYFILWVCRAFLPAVAHGSLHRRRGEFGAHHVATASVRDHHFRRDSFLSFRPRVLLLTGELPDVFVIFVLQASVVCNV